MTGPLALTQPPKQQFFIPGTTQPLVGGLIFTYAAGTMTKQATYSNASGTPNTNPIILDANGECVCFLDSTLQYDIWVSPSTDTDPPTNSYYTVGGVGYGSMIDGLAPINSPVFTGQPEAPTPASGDSSTNIATTAFVQEAITAEFAGSPTTTTQPAHTNNTTVATTAYVGTEIQDAWNMAVISNSGSWSVPIGVENIKVRLWGAGGGGGGGTTGGSAGSGGGAGAYLEGILSVGTNTSLTIAIGSGGSAGGANAAGSSGGSSTIAALGLTAGGGGGGAANGGSPGSGGSSSGATLNLSGSEGGVTLGNGIQGFGGAPNFGSISAGAGAYPAGGGAGGVINGAGNAGGAGLCIIEWLAP
jgi:hypothetical protein